MLGVSLIVQGSEFHRRGAEREKSCSQEGSNIEGESEIVGGLVDRDESRDI